MAEVTITPTGISTSRLLLALKEALGIAEGLEAENPGTNTLAYADDIKGLIAGIEDTTLHEALTYSVLELQGRELANFQKILALQSAVLPIPGLQSNVTALQEAVTPIPTLLTTVTTLQTAVLPIPGLQDAVDILQSDVSTLQTTVAPIADMLTDIANLQDAVTPISTLDSNLTAVMQSITNVIDGAKTESGNSELATLVDAILAVRVMDIAFQAGLSGAGELEDLTTQTYGAVLLARPTVLRGSLGLVQTEPEGADIVIDVLADGVSIFSTEPTITDTTGAYDPGVIDSVEHPAGTLLEFKVTQVGSTTPGQGLVFTLKGVVGD